MMKTIYVPSADAGAWQQFSAAAAAERRSVSSLLMMLIRAYLAEHDGS